MDAKSITDIVKVCVHEFPNTKRGIIAVRIGNRLEAVIDLKAAHEYKDALINALVSRGDQGPRTTRDAQEDITKWLINGDVITLLEYMKALESVEDVVTMMAIGKIDGLWDVYDPGVADRVVKSDKGHIELIPGYVKVATVGFYKDRLGAV